MKLVKTLAAAILMSCAALVGAAEADPPTVIGRLNHISGPVSFAPARADEDWVAASLNRPLTTGDRLWTDAGGRAEMHVGSLAIRMDALSSLDILNLDDRGLQLRLAQGSANVRVRRATANEPVEIATPGGAVVLARPGSYRMNVDPRGAVTSVAVRGGGPAEVFGQNGSFLVSDGQQATIAGFRPNLAALPAPDDFDRWSAARDGREDRVAATRYVPAAMTGYEDLDEYGTWRTVPQYGTVWQPTSVPAGWAPYRYGHWVWIDPWGWTWVDDAPWGFAPSHYGRWIWLADRWAWAPGRLVAQPVYAPALVAFIGGANFSVSVGVGSAPAVGWVPLGWHEPYRPWYRSSHAHVREVNIANVTNATNITNVRYVNRGAPSAVTVVSRETFAGARPVQRAALKVSPRTAAAAPVAVTPSVAAPSTASLALARPGARPPAEIRTREAVAVSTPRRPDRTALREDGDNRSRAAAGADREHPRVRVIDRRERVNPVQGEPRVAERQMPVSPPPESATARERAAEKADARPRQGAERRVPAPPAEVTGRPTFDRSGRMQAAPQPDNRAAQAQDAQRSRGEPQPERRDEQQGRLAQQERQRQADREQAQRQADNQRQVEQRNAQQRQPAQQERERQPAAEQQAQRQRADEERAREQSRHQQAQQRAQQQAEQRAQQQGEREAQLRAQEQARQREHAQRAEQQAQQRAQQQAEQRAAQQAQRQAQQHVQEQARQQQQAQRAEQQAQQRAQQQAEQRAAQQAQRQAQQHVQEQARQQQQAQRAEQQAQPQQRQERRDQSQEKGGRERPRGEKAEKG